jgi:hypothetical protein
VRREKARVLSGEIPTRQLSLQPVAIGAAALGQAFIDGANGIIQDRPDWLIECEERLDLLASRQMSAASKTLCGRSRPGCGNQRRRVNIPAEKQSSMGPQYVSCHAPRYAIYRTTLNLFPFQPKNIFRSLIVSRFT